MKATPDHNSPTSNQGESQSKKILVFTLDEATEAMLLHELESTGHIIMATVNDPNQLILEVARTTPHLLVAHTREGTHLQNLIQTKILSVFPDLLICFLDGHLSSEGHSWKQMLQTSLSRPIAVPSPRNYADSQRIVCHEKSLMALWKGKLNRPEHTPGWEKVCEGQEGRFLMQLQTGSKNHQAARHYFECLQRQQAGLDQEIGYRLAHGSYKALSWSRDLAVKWLALLAHYMPNVDLQFLPIAGTPGPAIDYVHHDVSIEGSYAGTLLLLAKIKPMMATLIKILLTARFDQQDDESLLGLSLQLYGTAKLFEQVGKAQVALMDAWLDPARASAADEDSMPRGERRNAGIYRDFYDFTFIVNSPEPLNSIIRGFHAGTSRVEHGQMYPTFVQFQRLFAESQSSNQPAQD